MARLTVGGAIHRQMVLDWVRISVKAQLEAEFTKMDLMKGLFLERLSHVSKHTRKAKLPSKDWEGSEILLT